MKPIFRQAALERLSSPEQLDQLMHVTTPRGWLALLALIGLIVTVAAWSISDTIPTEALGRGILIRGGRLLSIVTPEPGQIQTLGVRVGDLVRPGQVVARVRSLSAEDQRTAEIASAYGGRVVAVGAVQGGVVEAGGDLVTLEDAAQPLEAVVYMPAASAKNVQPGMEVQVSPTNVSRQEYGFLRGRVRSVGAFPSTFQSMMLVMANDQLVREFLADGTPIEIRVDLEPDPSVSSGYRWSSSAGPPIAIDSGTLCMTTITLSEQQPINFVLPLR
jgi:hypothetical protein